MQTLLAHLVDHAHAAAAQFFEYVITGDHGPGRGGSIRSHGLLDQGRCLRTNLGRQGRNGADESMIVEGGMTEQILHGGPQFNIAVAGTFQID